MATLEKPSWVPDISEYVDTPVDPNLDLIRFRTGFVRADWLIHVLERVVQQTAGTLNLCLVGVGRETNEALCPYEPYLVTAFLEGQSRNYRAVIVDKDPTIIDDLKMRRKIYLPERLEEPRVGTSFVANALDRYIAATKQQPRLVEASQLENTDPANAILWSGEGRSRISGRYFVLDIPESFCRKLLTGEVAPACGDIVTINLTRLPQMHFISMLNVMYLINEVGQKLALYNLARKLEKNSRLLTNQIGGGAGTPLFAELGGWLNSEKLADLGLVEEESVYSNDLNGVTTKSKVSVLRKEL